ncbi:hypothetical protein GCM10027203_44100 [Nonomuraea fastidiosa]
MPSAVIRRPRSLPAPDRTGSKAYPARPPHTLEPTEIRVWTQPQSSSSWDDDGDRMTHIVEIQDNGHGGAFWDTRCW